MPSRLFPLQFEPQSPDFFRSLLQSRLRLQRSLAFGLNRCGCAGTHRIRGQLQEASLTFGSSGPKCKTNERCLSQFILYGRYAVAQPSITDPPAVKLLAQGQLCGMSP
jgi:hypothetical protein